MRTISHFVKRSGICFRCAACVLLTLVFALQGAFSASASVIAEFGRTTLSQTVEASSGRKYKIKLSFSEDAGIPADAALSAALLTENDEYYDAYVEQAETALDCAGDEESEVILFDISLVSSQDAFVVYQPAEGANVQVSVTLADAVKNEIGVVHFGEEPEVIDSSVSGKQVSFDATGFSVYALVDFRYLIPEDEFIYDATAFDRQPLYISSTVKGSEYYMSSGIVPCPAAGTNVTVIKRTAANSSEGAVPYYFEKVPGGAANEYYIYYYESSTTKKYVKLTGSSKSEYTDSPVTVFTVTPYETASHRYYITFQTGNTTYYLNLRKDQNGTGFGGSDWGPANGKTSDGSIMTPHI
ncbi:MAG: hypothetical protein K6C36_10255 [Clostridia bacterium]|nr:hypothetical protein [Clostridia bacterium]